MSNIVGAILIARQNVLYKRIKNVGVDVLGDPQEKNTKAKERENNEKIKKSKWNHTRGVSSNYNCAIDFSWSSVKHGNGRIAEYLQKHNKRKT